MAKDSTARPPAAPRGPAAATLDCAEEPRAQRSDARRNRARVLAAAEAEFASHGIAVQMDDIAKRAGVGVGTVYRHFPTKEALFEEIVYTRLERLACEARELADMEDPGGALFDFLAKLVEQGSSKRDLADALSGAGVDLHVALSQVKLELEAAVRVLLERAQKAGVVRDDVVIGDLIGLVAGSCTAGKRGVGSSSPTRMFAVIRDGLRA